MPGAVPITSTNALTNATLPYAIALADEGVAGAIRRDPGLRPGVNVAAGVVTHPAVAEGVAMTCVPVEEALEISADRPETGHIDTFEARRPLPAEVDE
jgi:alanine dehydrogenase